MRRAAVNDLLGRQKFGRLHLKKILESQYIKPWGSFLLNGDKKNKIRLLASTWSSCYMANDMEVNVENICVYL